MHFIFIFALLAVFLGGLEKAQAQAIVLPCVPSGNSCIPVSASNPLPTSGGTSASVTIGTTIINGSCPTGAELYYNVGVLGCATPTVIVNSTATSGGALNCVWYNASGSVMGCGGLTTDGTNVSFTGRMFAPSGTASLPAYGSSVDANTGLYFCPSGTAIGWGLSGNNNSALDYNCTNFGAMTASSPIYSSGILDSNVVLAHALAGYGTGPALTGTCTSSLGGNSRNVAGSFTATCTAQTIIFTFSYTAPTGWVCWANDTSVPTDSLRQTGSSATTATLTGTTGVADTILYGCLAY